ncbi:conjugative relaxase domain-containing protein, TrwC/TraI family [Micromonospora aurantiaca]|nr:conjugative relaxase domain-containing protein, TrwC/TraI family [Micromonospora aurantiaca]SCL21464.1 conjugative relaxase domain-containing protein, TrwC/TraI family [Micromonospora aurantiaca]
MYWCKIISYDPSMTVRVTKIPVGMAGARYPWECRSHEHDRQAYYHKGQEAGPVARWLGAGVERLGYEQGSEVVKEEHLTLFGELCDPRLHAELTARAEAEIRELGLKGDEAKAHYDELLKGARLGRAPRQYRSVEERLAEALKAEPDADEFRREELRRKIEADPRGANGSFDVTFSAQKSISLYRAGLLAQGRVEDAAKVEAAHRAGVEAALEYLQREAGFTRVGYHGSAGPDGASRGRWVDAHEWVAAEFLHETSRAGDVQMHSHLQVLNRVPTIDDDGTVVWRTLDSRALNKARPGMEAVYHRTMEEQLTRDLPVDLETREDGKAREIIGITLQDREAASTRRQQIKGELAEYVELYRQRTGHEPSPQTLSKMAERAALQTRDRKDAAVPMDELVDRWEREAVAADRRTHAQMAENAEAAAVSRRLARMRAEQPAPVLDRGRVIAQALGEVQSERSKFGRDDVMRCMARALPEQLGTAAEEAGGVAALLESLTDEALTSGAYGVVQVSGFEVIDAPQQLRRESDGRSVYQPGRTERFSTETQLREEERMVATASRTDAPRLSPEQIEDAIEASTLGEDQAAAVRGVLGDGRQVSVIVGPAGTGKSYAQGVITKAWEEAGGKVIGLAPSSVAAAVLADAGVSTTTNITKFLDLYEGRGAVADIARFRLRPGDLVIVDEAAMANHPDMAKLVQIVADAGAKMATVGDDAQMQSVGTGGGFRLLRQDLGAYELRTVRRFRDGDQVRGWEADASLGLRDGKVEVLAAYEEHGRLHGGTAEEMADAAVRRYVADTLAGRYATLTTSTNETADELSARIRAELVRLGRVEEGGAAVLGGNVAGIGDLVQTRRNDGELLDSEGLPVINRRMYRVTELHDDGSLTVRRVAGRDAEGREQLAGTVRLDPDYVRECTALGYAGTVHATQGRTVDRGYLYGDANEGLSREAAYVALTRGTELNEAFLVTERTVEDRIQGMPEDVPASTPVAEMARILEREATEKSASESLREGLEYAESMPALAPMWVDVTTRHTREQCRTLLADILGPDAVARLDAEQADPLYRHLRETQLQGHDVEALLRDAIGDPRSLADARELGALLQYRVEQAAARRTPEHEPAGPDWLARTPDIDGPEGEFAREVAEAMQTRQDELGRRAAEQTPAWAIDRLGELPEQEPERTEWEQRAGVVEAYRELYGVDGEGTVIGQAPPRGAVEQRAAWDAAYEALGRPDEHRHIAAASDEELRAMLARYEREQVWAPPYLGQQMADAHQLARDYEERATLAEAEAATLADAQERAELAARAAAWRDMAAGYAEQAATYEEITDAHRAWRADTEDVRETAQAAATELDRRQVDRQPAEQVAVDHEQAAAGDAEHVDQVHAGRDEAQHEKPVRDVDQEHAEVEAVDPADVRQVREAEPAAELETDVAASVVDEPAPQAAVDGRQAEVEPAAGEAEQAHQAEQQRDQEVQAMRTRMDQIRQPQPEQPQPSEHQDAARAASVAAAAFPRTIQQELREARTYLERRAQRAEAAQRNAEQQAAQRAAEQEENARRESARLMRERQAAERSRSRGYER